MMALAYQSLGNPTKIESDPSIAASSLDSLLLPAIFHHHERYTFFMIGQTSTTVDKGFIILTDEPAC